MAAIVANSKPPSTILWRGLRIDPLASQTEALTMAKQLIGSFPHARPPEFETYLAALAAVLSDYPASIAAACCDPRSGLARNIKFPPTAAEVIEWCEEKAISLRPTLTPDYRQQLYLPEPIDRSERPSLEELRAKYGPNWGLKTL